MTKAVTLAELADQNTFFVDGTHNRIGIATNNPQSTLQVGIGITMDGNAGVVTAQAYYGDGSNLTGIDATSLKDTGGNVKIQANESGAVITGIVTASSFEGDGSKLSGVSGFATALSPTPTSPLFNIFKTSKTLTVGSGLSVTVESDVTSGNIAFMRETNIHVSTGSTFHIGSGTTLFTNVLNLF